MVWKLLRPPGDPSPSCTQFFLHRRSCVAGSSQSWCPGCRSLAPSSPAPQLPGSQLPGSPVPRLPARRLPRSGKWLLFVRPYVPFRTPLSFSVFHTLLFGSRKTSVVGLSTCAARFLRFYQHLWSFALERAQRSRSVRSIRRFTRPAPRLALTPSRRCRRLPLQLLS